MFCSGHPVSWLSRLLGRGLSFRPDVGQQRGELIGRTGRQAREDVFQVQPRVDAEALASDREAGQHRRSLAAGFAAPKEPVLAAHGCAAQRVLRRVVVDAQIAVGDIDVERRPLVQRVTDRLAQRTLVSVRPKPFLRDRLR